MDKVLQNYLPGGAFQDVPVKRSRAMAAIRGKANKSTEIKLRMVLVSAGVSGWKFHPKGVLGSPDFFFPAKKLAVFVDGCFWHGCPACRKFSKVNVNKGYWTTKITVNKNRDRRMTRMLRAHGLSVVRLWEHELNSPSSCLTKILRALGTHHL